MDYQLTDQQWLRLQGPVEVRILVLYGLLIIDVIYYTLYVFCVHMYIRIYGICINMYSILCMMWECIHAGQIQCNIMILILLSVPVSLL